MTQPRSRRNDKLFDKYVEELRPIADRTSGARARVDPARRSALRALLDRERERNPLVDVTLASLLEVALRASNSIWSRVAMQILDVDPQHGEGAKGDRFDRAAHLLGLKTRRSIERTEGAGKWGGQNPLELALAHTAEMLVKYDEQLPALPDLEPGCELEAVESALSEAIRRRAWRVSVPDGLQTELKHVLLDAYDNLRLIHHASCFVSLTPALQLRMNLHDPDDMLYVLSRRDDKLNVTRDSDWKEYLAWMRRRVDELRTATGDDAAGINHVRLVVRDDPAPMESGADDLIGLHGENSLFTIALGDLRRMPEIDLLLKLKYGFALSTKHNYALVTVPHAPPDPEVRLTPLGIAQYVRSHADRGVASDGHLHAIVSADRAFVRGLRTEFETALSGPDTDTLR